MPPGGVPDDETAGGGGHTDGAGVEGKGGQGGGTVGVPAVVFPSSSIAYKG